MKTLRFSEICALDEARNQQIKSSERQVCGLQYALEAAWYWLGDVGPREQPHKLRNEIEDFGL